MQEELPRGQALQHRTKAKHKLLGIGFSLFFYEEANLYMKNKGWKFTWSYTFQSQELSQWLHWQLNCLK